MVIVAAILWLSVATGNARQIELVGLTDNMTTCAVAIERTLEKHQDVIEAMREQGMTPRPVCLYVPVDPELSPVEEL